MSVHDAEPGDIYADGQGKLWRVVGICREPTVTVEEVEPSGHSSDQPSILGLGAAQAMVGGITSPKGSFIRQRKGGGISGLMWDGFQRIWREKRS